MASNYERRSSCLSDGRTVPDDGSPNTELLDKHNDKIEIKFIDKPDVLKNHLSITVEKNKIRDWKEQKNCDIEIRCGEFKTKAHSDVLSNVSDYFQGSSNFNKKARKIILNEDCISSEALCHVVNFAYSGDLEIRSDRVQDLLETAFYLQVKLILDECENFLINSTDQSTAISLLQCAIKFNLRNLIDTIVLYVFENFDTFVGQNLFCTLSYEEFKFLLMQRNLSVFRKGIPVVNPELHIIDAVGKTITANQVNDTSSVKSILSAIVFSEIPQDNLSSIYDSYPVFQTIDKSTFTTLQTCSLMKERTFSNSSKHLETSMSYLKTPSHFKFEKSFEEISDINDRPKKIWLWVTRWDMYIVIGGIRIEYQSRTTVLHGILPEARHSILSEHEFELDDDEVITKINLRSGLLLDSISFDTNYGRTYGPYGGNGGYPSSLSPSQKRGYFHSFRGIVKKGRYDHFLTITDCTWVVFTTPSTDNYDRLLKERSKSEDDRCIMESLRKLRSSHNTLCSTMYGD